MTSRIASDSFVKLKLRNGGRKLRLHGTSFRVGRARQCELFVDGSWVSRQHARLVLEGTSWFIEDTDSANGVFLNGRKVDYAQLRPGDLLEIGARGPVIEVHDMAPKAHLVLETDTEF